jgi:formylmethanofuran dehydrogenase subunit C
MSRWQMTALALTLSATAAADVVTWISSDSLEYWSDASNWSPVGPSAGDYPMIGTTAQAENNWVRMDQDVSGLVGMEIWDGMTLDTYGNLLDMSGADLVIIGENQIGNIIYSSRLSVKDSPADPFEFWARDVAILDDADLWLYDGAGAVIEGTLSIGPDSLVHGFGTIRLDGDNPRSLNNNGAITGRTLGPLTITQNGAGKIDLDGSAENGKVFSSGYNLETMQGELVVVNAPVLHDAFDGFMKIGSRCEMQMNIDVGWLLGADGELQMWGEEDGPAVLTGDLFGVLGTINAISEHASIQSETIVFTGSNVNVSDFNKLSFDGPTDIDGGTFTVEADGLLELNGPTTVEDATFQLLGGTTTGALLTNTGSGMIMGYGTVDNRVINDTSIIADGGTLVVNGLVNDWDGSSQVGQLQALTGSLHLTDLANAAFNGRMQVAGDEEIFLDGFRFTTNPPSAIDMFGGKIRSDQTQRIGGEVTVFGEARFETDVEFLSTADVALGAILRLQQQSTIAPGATFAGNEALVVGSSGALTLEGGAGLDVDVRALGSLIIENGIGQASVNGNVEVLSTLLMQLGGTGLGDYDQLFVADNLEMRGHLQVHMLGYVPTLGDEFDILDFDMFVDLGYTMNLPVIAPELQWDTSTLEIDGVLRVTQDTCLPDIDDDGFVGVEDLILVILTWDTNNAHADIDGSGVVGVDDMLQVVLAWGPC